MKVYRFSLLAVCCASLALVTTSPVARATDRGSISFTGTFTRTASFNPLVPDVFGTFGTMTVSSASGMFTGLTGALSMSTATLTTRLTGSPLMTWTIGGFTFATTFAFVPAASAGDASPPVIGFFDVSGNGYNFNTQGWQFAAPGPGASGPITLRLNVADGVAAVPERGETLLLLLLAMVPTAAFTIRSRNWRGVSRWARRDLA